MPNAQVICEQSIGGEIVVNTYAVRSLVAGPGLTDADATDIAGAALTIYEGTTGAVAPNRGIKNLREQNASLNRIIVREILAGNTPGPFYEFGVESDGSSTGAATAVQLSLVVSLRTTIAGRSGRGRVYLGPFTENEQDELATVGQWNGPVVQDCVDAIQDFATRLEGLVPNGYQLAVWSRKDALFYGVVGIRSSSKIYTQRRRNVKTPTTFATATVI